MEWNELPDELADIRHKNTYTTPPGYFDTLADDILNRIQLPAHTNMPFSAPPVAYFDGLADFILSKIKSDTRADAKNEVEKELEDIDSFLASLPKTNVYRVPDGYFETFQVTKPVKQEPAKVISTGASKNWFAYASAAVITGILALGILFFVNRKADSTGVDGYATNYKQALQKLPDNEISDYLATNTSTDADFAAALQEAAPVFNAEDLYKTLLNNLSDKEIQDYLKTNSEANEKDIKGI